MSGVDIHIKAHKIDGLAFALIAGFVMKSNNYVGNF